MSDGWGEGWGDGPDGDGWQGGEWQGGAEPWRDLHEDLGRDPAPAPLAAGPDRAGAAAGGAGPASHPGQPDVAARPGRAVPVLAEAAVWAKPVALAGEQVLPVLPALRGLWPGGGLRRGSTVAVAGSRSLALAVLAGPSAAGSWCAAVGLPSLGLVAAAEVGVDLGHLALVADPGSDWAAVVAALLDALDVVLVGPPDRVRSGDHRRLVARARERGAVLVVAGAWEGADVRLTASDRQWTGLGLGHGHLQARRIEVVAEGRGAAARPRRAHLWLPAPHPPEAAAAAGSEAWPATAAGAGVRWAG